MTFCVRGVGGTDNSCFDHSAPGRAAAAIVTMATACTQSDLTTVEGEEDEDGDDEEAILSALRSRDGLPLRTLLAAVHAETIPPRTVHITIATRFHHPLPPRTVHIPRFTQYSSIHTCVQVVNPKAYSQYKYSHLTHSARLQVYLLTKYTPV
jgi:hypothetical protein